MIRKRLIDLSREECVELLENKAGIQCYDHEDLPTLIEAVRVNIDDGTLSEEDLPEETRDTILYGRGLGPRPFTG